ncbi:MAG: alpha-xylosidase, partial [Chitinivibrionales bacterium]|nr:alpha-xylosidase [Chitinivibrionales bacterium]
MYIGGTPHGSGRRGPSRTINRTFEGSSQPMQQHYGSDSYASTYRPDKSIHQDDTRIFHRCGYVYDSIDSVRRAECVGGRLELELQLTSGRPAYLSIAGVDEHTLRIRMHAGKVRFDETSLMVPKLPARPPRGRLKRSSGEFRFSVAHRVVVIGRQPFSLRIEGEDGKVILELETERIAGKQITAPLGLRSAQGQDEPFMSWKLGVDERYFGLGEKFNKVEKTSTRATIWSSDTCGSNTCDLSYKSIPVLFSTAGWGLMLHSSYRSFWEIGSFSYTAGSVLTEDPKLDAFLFFGSSLKELIERYTGLTGRPTMPPKWALGVWMSRCQYENRQQVDEVVARLRQERIPCDVVHLDPLWMKTHYYYKIGVDACDFVRNDEGFPDLPALFAEYRKRGFSTCLWINPYIPEGTPIYREAEEKGFLLRSEQGGLARLEHGNPVGMVDFSNPQAMEWWKDHLRELARDGASVFKPDYGDRVPEDALFHDGRRGREMHNLYLYFFTRAPYEVIREVHGEGIVWRRAGYIGSQRYPGTWAGDTQVSWKGMRGCFRGGLSAGLSGEAFWSHDIGGFTGPPPSEELYCRWAQFGLLSPLSRFHGTTPREPWHYGETAMKVVRHYARLRYSLIPYLLVCAEQSCETGIPIMRHMALEFPGEPNIDTIDDQY